MTNPTRLMSLDVFRGLADAFNESLLFALSNLVVLWVILYWMDRRGSYLKA